MNNKMKLGVSFIVSALVAIVLGFTVLAWKAGVVIAIAVLLVWAVLSWRHRNKIVSCFLASCMSVAPNLFGEGFSAGYNGQQCYCFEPAAIDPNPPVQEAVKLTFILSPNEAGEIQPRILSMEHPDPRTLVDWDGLNASLAAWGIDLNRGEQYATNGVPATAADVPFTFGDWSNPLIIQPEQTQYRVVVEVATELGSEFTYWQQLAHFSVPANTRIELMDSPEGAQTFYRIRLETPPEDFQPAGPVLLGCGLGLLFGFAVVGVLTVRACARNKKKFQNMLPPPATNQTNQVNINPNE